MLDLNADFLHPTHPGVPPEVASYYAAAATVCLHRHHCSPVTCKMSVPPEDPTEVEIRWEQPSTDRRRAYRNALSATEIGACGLALVATEERLGLVAVMQAEAFSGGDYYLMPTGREVPHDRDLNLETDDIALLEVSGIDLDNDTKMETRLRSKADQVRAQGWAGRAIAGVVGFRGAGMAGGGLGVSLDLHRQAEVLMGRGNELRARGNEPSAAGAYRAAAQLEAEAFALIPLDRPRTRGVVAVSAVALYRKAGDSHEALRHAYLYLGDDRLPGPARRQLSRLVESLRSGHIFGRYVGALDQGTTSTRFMIFDHSGQVVGIDQKEHEQIYPKPGWVEHDPMEIWARSQDVIKGALAKARITAADLAAVGVTNQRETTVVWDKVTGKPVYNAIVWQDTRTADICNELAKDGGQDRLRPKTGLPLATYFSGPKVKWILDNVPGAREKAEKGELLFGNIDTWCIWNLTGGKAHVTDVTNGSRTLMMNLETLDWDPEILKLMNVPRAMLPAVRASSEVYGTCVGALAGVPCSGDLGDQQAALFGQTCFSPGEAKNTYGTGCFMLLNTGTKAVPSKSGLLTTLGYKIGKQPAVYALEGSIAITGALVQWLRDNLGLIEKSADIETLAATVEDNGGIYFVPAFSGLFAPYWKNDARGVIAGMTRYVNKGHIARAALEATAWQTREVLDAMNADSGVPLTALKVDGGMVYNDLLMQFQSDVLNVPVIRPVVAETTALGAAYAAGLAVGYWAEVEDLRVNWAKDKEWHPKMDEATRVKDYKDWKKAVTRTFGWME